MSQEAGDPTESYVPISWVMKILKEFRAIDCHFCTKNLGYENQRYPGLYVCSSHACLSQKLQALEEKISECSVSNEADSREILLKKPPVGYCESKTKKFGDQENLQLGIQDRLSNPNIGNPKLKTRRNRNLRRSGHIDVTDDSSPEMVSKVPLGRFENENTRLSVGANGGNQRKSLSSLNSIHTAVNSNSRKSLGTPGSSLATVAKQRKASAASSDVSNRDELDLVKTTPKIPQKEPPVASSLTQVDPSSLSLPKRKKRWTLQNARLSSSLRDQSRVTIKFVWSPFQFTVTSTVDEAKLEELQGAISAYCAKEPSMFRLPAIGEILFAPYDGEFYRAVVQDIYRDKRNVRVSFLDYGDCSDVCLDSCKEPCDRIMEDHPIYGIRFECLLKVPVPKGFPLTGQIRSVFEKEVGMEIDVKRQWIWRGKIRLGNSETLNELLENQIAEFCQSNPEKMIGAGRAECGEGSNQVLNDSAQGLKAVTAISTMKISASLEHGAIVRVAYMFGLDKVMVSSPEDLPKVQELQSVIRACVKSAPGIKSPPAVGELLIAPTNADGMYARCAVEEVHGDQVKVRFLDIGGIGRVGFKDLKVLSPEIHKYPLYSIVFMMANLPKDIPQMWIPELKLCLESKCQIEVLSRRDDIWTGRLWVARDRTWNEIVLKALEGQTNQ